MFDIFYRTQALPKKLVNVDFAKSKTDDFFAHEQRKKILPMAKKEMIILRSGFSFKSVFDRYSLGA